MVKCAVITRSKRLAMLIMRCNSTVRRPRDFCMAASEVQTEVQSVQYHGSEEQWRGAVEWHI